MALLASLVSVRYAIEGFGAERFGVWATISSLALVLSFTDFGVSNGIVSAIARSNATGDSRSVAAIISTAAALVAFFACALFIVGIATVEWLDWRAIFGLHDATLAVEAREALFVAIFFVSANLALSIVPRAQSALQDSHIWPKWQLLGSGLSIAAVIAVSTRPSPLWWLVAALMGPNLTVSLGNAISYFARRPDLRPRAKLASRQLGVTLLRTGLLFFVLQLAAAITTSSDVLLVSHIFGPTAAADYSVHQRLFAVVSGLLSIAIAPLWPAYADARARHDEQWIRQCLRWSTVAAFVLGAMAAALLYFVAPTLIQLWVGSKVVAIPCLLLGLGVWLVLESWGVAMAAYLNGLSIIRVQLALNLAFMVVCLGLRYVLLSRLDVCGVPLATSIAYGVTIFLPYMFLFQRKQ